MKRDVENIGGKFFDLRPKSLDEFIGHEKVKRNLKVYLDAAKKRGDSLDHILLSGPSGVGKTTLAFIIANELNHGIKVASAPVIERAGELVSLLTSLEDGDVLFIDEIHRLNTSLEEILYSAMEDFSIDIIVGSGPGARSIRLRLPRFTLIGATTKEGLISSPLRSRFGIVLKLDYYSPDELVEIIKRSSRVMSITVTDDSAYEIAKRSRGTPRVANKLLRRIRDFAEVMGKSIIDMEVTKRAFEELEIDELGLDSTDRKLLFLLVEHFNCGPVGIDTLAVSLGEEKRTIEEVYEPFLIREGFIKRTPRGRVATAKAVEFVRGRIE